MNRSATAGKSPGRKVRIFCDWVASRERSFTSLADSEDMSIGVAHVHLSHVPWLIRRRPSYFKPLCDAVLVDGVHIIHPNRHPLTLVGGFVAFRTEGHLDVALATPPLTVFAQKDLALA